MRIRPAIPADRSFIRQLSARVFARFGDYETTLPEMAGLPEVYTLVAESGRSAVGYAMYTFEAPGEADLVAIAVDPDWQNQGIGKLLLQEVESAVRHRVSKAGMAVRLSVALDNASARRLFERHGYSYLPEDQGVYPGGQPSIAMCKRLTPIE